jgi:hypothetical protein
MATYSGGALLAGFVLALRSRRVDPVGFLWAAPLSVLLVFALAWHTPWSGPWVWAAVGAAAVLRGVSGLRPRNPSGSAARPGWRQHVGFVLALVLIVAAERWAVFPNGNPLAWPWYIPVGSLYTYTFARWLGRNHAQP